MDLAKQELQIESKTIINKCILMLNPSLQNGRLRMEQPNRPNCYL